LQSRAAQIFDMLFLFPLSAATAYLIILGDCFQPMLAQTFGQVNGTSCGSCSPCCLACAQPAAAVNAFAAACTAAVLRR
jgi:hypothetical protein